jgi:hypothetical protein
MAPSRWARGALGAHAGYSRTPDCRTSNWAAPSGSLTGVREAAPTPRSGRRIQVTHDTSRVAVESIESITLATARAFEGVPNARPE